ncbi:hypothetical protein ACFL49_02940 [Candidatus Omnitrophota bacterium]
MKKIFLIFVIGVIFCCGLIIGMHVGAEMYVLKKIAQVKDVVCAAVELPIKAIPKIAVLPLQITADLGGKVLNEMKRVVEYPLVYLTDFLQ